MQEDSKSSKTLDVELNILLAGPGFESESSLPGPSLFDRVDTTSTFQEISRQVSDIRDGSQSSKPLHLAHSPLKHEELLQTEKKGDHCSKRQI